MVSMGLHRMFQNALLAEYHRTFYDTPSNKMHHLGALPSKQVYERERYHCRFLFAHKLAPLSFKPMCLRPYGKNQIFPQCNGTLHFLIFIWYRRYPCKSNSIWSRRRKLTGVVINEIVPKNLVYNYFFVSS